ncbi:V-type ATPase subunit [candidate division WOR-3 bacterium]|nr:V-type ATPase subunit [candidate division WOR-3 bacterium]
MRKPYFEKAPSDNKYNFAVSLVRCFENNLIDASRYERLLESASVSSALKILHETPYGQYAQQAGGDYESVLLSRKREVFSFFIKHCEEESARSYVMSSYDYHNLKTAVKSRFSKKTSRAYSEFGALPLEIFKFIAEEQETEDEIVFPLHIERALEQALEGYYEDKDPRVIDLVVDRHLFEHLQRSVEISRSPYLAELLSLKADTLNTVTFLRLKKQKEETVKIDPFVPGGKIERESFMACLYKSIDDFKALLSLSEYYDLAPYVDADPIKMENKAQEMEMDMLKQARFFLNGFEPIVSYFLSVDMEIRNLRKIFISKKSKISLDTFGTVFTEVA